MSLELHDGGLAPYLILILFGFLPSEIWRWISVFLARGIDEGSELFVFVRTIASVLLVGVVARLVLLPTGALLVIPLAARLGALGAGAGAFLLFRRSVLAAVIAGEAAMLAAGFYFTR